MYIVYVVSYHHGCGIPLLLCRGRRVFQGEEPLPPLSAGTEASGYSAQVQLLGSIEQGCDEPEQSMDRVQMAQSQPPTPPALSLLERRLSSAVHATFT